MKKSFIKNLLDRRFPQIVGSYFVGATSLLLFLDWLVVKYHLSDVQDSIATAKITCKLLPFSYPEIGDKINLK